MEFTYLYEPGVAWVNYQPRARMRVLHDVFPEGILIPELLIGRNAIHLPTTKTHVFTGITGAMKNAFGGLLRENRHWTHAVTTDARRFLATRRRFTRDLRDGWHHRGRRPRPCG